MVALQRNADDVRSSEDLVEFSQRLITEDMSQQMFTYAFVFIDCARNYLLRLLKVDLMHSAKPNAIFC